MVPVALHVAVSAGSGCSTADTLAACAVCDCFSRDLPLLLRMLLLQSGTSHNLGDNFARAFNTQFIDEQQQMR